MKRDWKAEAVKQWDADPCGADRETALGTPEFFARVERERYIEYAPWMKPAIGFERYRGKDVLEVGFGLGTDLASFARVGARCFGTDITPTHVRAAKRRMSLEGYPVRLLRGDAENLPFSDESFDVVYSFGVLHHTPDTPRSIDEIHRVLRRGGEAIVGLYHRNSLFFWYHQFLLHGLVAGGFLRAGYRRTLSRIESRNGSDAVPLVKVYSRRSARRLFSSFSAVTLTSYHFDLAHLGALGRAAKRIWKSERNAVAQRFGWYLIVRGVKF